MNSVMNGHAVDVACDGEEAGVLARVYDYDLSILDVVLPGKHGLELVADVHVGNLRRKLRKAAGMELIRTVWGV